MLRLLRPVFGSLFLCGTLGGLVFLLPGGVSVDAQTGAAPPPCQSLSQTKPYTSITLHCPAPPDSPVPRFSTESSPSSYSLTVDPLPQPDYDRFAWNSFIAMNWPALIPDQNGNQRGFPNTGASFAGAKPDDLAVWETFKEKREVFYYGPQGATAPVPDPPDPGPWNGPVNYLGQDAPDHHGIPWCAGQQPPPASAPISHHLFQSSKGFFNSLDETIEVASEALEEPNQLCQGYTDKKCACSAEDALTCLSSAPQPCCLSPNQSACCNVYGQAVAPRVWKKGSPPRPVYYEVKVNYDFYDYVRQNRYYIDNVKNEDAVRPAQENCWGSNNTPPCIRLPYRSNDTAPPSGKPILNNPGQVLGYTATACLSQYQQVNEFAGKHPPDHNGDFTPCRVGAIHLKAAWIELLPAEIQSNRFHTKKAVYFSTESIPGGQRTCRKVGTFGLIGLHIIQRVHPQLPSDAPPPLSSGPPYDPVRSSKVTGGAFVFATWEHKEIAPRDDQPSPDYVYANYFPGPISGANVNNGAKVPGKGFYPNPKQGLPLQRYFGKKTVLDSTNAVNEEVYKALGCKDGAPVWCNYRLIGVQAMPINVDDKPTPHSPYPPGPNDPTGIGQPLYLANLVIETNVGLQHFQGLPPNTDKAGIANYATALEGGIQPNLTPQFQRALKNVAFGRYSIASQPGFFTPVAHNMGGCMGCHGVSQIQGYSFSFVLQDGQEGAQPDTEEDFIVPPFAPPPPGSGGR